MRFTFQCKVPKVKCAEAVIRFRVISGAVRVGQYIFPLSTVVRVQFITLLVLFLIIVALIVWIWHDRRTMHRVKGSVDRRIEHKSVDKWLNLNNV